MNIISSPIFFNFFKEKLWFRRTDTAGTLVLKGSPVVRACKHLADLERTRQLLYCRNFQNRSRVKHLHGPTLTFFASCACTRGAPRKLSGQKNGIFSHLHADICGFTQKCVVRKWRLKKCQFSYVYMGPPCTLNSR